MIPVQYSNDSEPVAMVDIGEFFSSGNAEPTSRVLAGSDDHGYAEEWAEPGTVTIDGEQRPCRAIYLFTPNDVREQAEDYPWDAAHIARIVLND